METPKTPGGDDWAWRLIAGMSVLPEAPDETPPDIADTTDTHARPHRPLPYGARPLSHWDYAAFRPMLAHYLLQMHVRLAALSENETRRQWGRFVALWNQRALPAEWYQPRMCLTVVRAQADQWRECWTAVDRADHDRHDRHDHHETHDADSKAHRAERAVRLDTLLPRIDRVHHGVSAAAAAEYRQMLALLQGRHVHVYRPRVP